MNSIECPISLLKIKKTTRLQCLHGCLHYKRNPMCPPLCPDIDWFKQLIESYQKVNILFEIIEFADKADLINKKNIFQNEAIKIERKLKREGNYYALCFAAGPCAMCVKDNNCSLSECSRVLVGRTPVCATGVDLMHLSTEIMKLSKDDSLSYWIPILSNNYFDELKNKYLCLCLVFY